MNHSRINTAALYGLYLSLPSAITLLIQDTYQPGTFISILLWIFRFGFSIWLLFKFMKEWASNFEEFTYGNGVSFGFLTCTFSSMIVAVARWVSISFLNNEALQMAMQEAMERFEEQGNTQVIETMDSIMGNMPVIALFSTLLYCVIYGLILSSILASFCKKESFNID